MDEHFEVVEERKNKHGVDVKVLLNTKADTYLPYSKSPTIPEECRRSIRLEKEEWEQQCRGPESPEGLQNGWVIWRGHETQQSARDAAAEIDQEAALNYWFQEWRAKYSLVVRARTIEQIEAE